MISQIPFQINSEDETERETASQDKAMTRREWIEFSYGNRPKK